MHGRDWIRSRVQEGRVSFDVFPQVGFRVLVGWMDRQSVFLVTGTRIPKIPK